MNNNILTDEQLEHKAKVEHTSVYARIFNDRANRKNMAFINYMEVNGFTHVPKYTLEALNQMLDILNKQKNNSNVLSDNLTWINQKISEINSIIENNEYATPNTSDYTYIEDYKAQATGFIWPNEEELGIRSQEEQELLALLQQNS